MLIVRHLLKVLRLDRAFGTREIKDAERALATASPDPRFNIQVRRPKKRGKSRKRKLKKKK